MFNTWESYFYPPPNDDTLRNIQDIRDPQALQVFEYGAAAMRQRQLNTDPSMVLHTYDTVHMCSIHRYLFQDVYEWAGEHRTHNVAKSGMSRGFADVNTGEVGRYLADVHNLVKRTDWASLNRDEFARLTAHVFAYLNQAHPFRDGNGRTAKVFIEHVAQQSKFTLDYTYVSPQAWNQAAEFSRPDIGKYDVMPDILVPVFRRFAAMRP